MRVFTGGSELAAGDRAGDRADARVAPAHPHRRAHLRLPPRRTRSTACTARPGSSGARRKDLDLAACCERVGRAAAAVRARARGGTTRWPPTCSAALVEVVSGQTLDAFFAERIFGPLGMTDTALLGAGGRPRPARRAVRPRARHPRGCSATTRWARAIDRTRRRSCPAAAGWCRPPATTTASPRCSGGAASSTACGCSARAPSATWRTNHLPGGVDLEAFGQSTFAETTFDGVGFGLGFSVVQDPAANKVLSSPGEFVLGRRRVAPAFFVDPVEDITAVFLTQLLPVEHLHPPSPAQAGGVPSSRVDEPVLRGSGRRGHRAGPALRDRPRW